MRHTADTAFTAHRPGMAWSGAVTPRRDGLIGVRRSVRVSATALRMETAPPD